MGKITGFSKKLNKHTNAIDAHEILRAPIDEVYMAVLFHAAMLRALISQGTSRAGNNIKIWIKLDGEEASWWINTPEEALPVLCEINELLITTAVERGLLEAPKA